MNIWNMLTLSDIFMLAIGFCLGNAFQCAIRGPWGGDLDNDGFFDELERRRQEDR